MYANIPAELKALRQWCVWRKVQRDGKWTKQPFKAASPFIECDITDKSQLGTFDEATSATGVDGIGFALTAEDPYCFIDLDNPKESDPELHAVYCSEQRKIAETFQSYQEISPGGGLHIICKASVIAGKRKSDRGIEIYSDDRYMTMTGNIFKDAPIIDEQHFAQTLWMELGGDEKKSKKLEETFNADQSLEDGELYDRCQNAKNGQKFLDLWTGDWVKHHRSQSEADQTLLNMLAFHSQNHEQLRRMFALSALGKREKAKRKKYVDESIALALDQAFEVLDFTALQKHIEEFVMRARQASAEREQRRIDGINEALQRKYDENQRIAAEQIEAQQHRVEDSAYSLAPPIAATEEFESPPGLLGEIAQFVYAQSPYPLPRTALVAAIAFLSAICGRAFNVNGLGCNLYLLLVAPTGVGKESISSGISKLALALGEIIPGSRSYFGLDQIASGQALYVAMKERKACLSIQTEFGIELQNITHPRAPSPIKMLKKAYLELFTKSGEGNMLGASVFADKTKNTEPLQSPSLTILGETAPPHLYDALNETMLADGLIPRFLLLEVEKGDEKYNPWAHTIKPSGDLMQRIAALMASIVKLDHLNRAAHVTMDAEAQYLAEQYRANTKRSIESQTRESGRQVWSRAHVKVLKLAALVAIGCNPFNPVIDGPTLRWAMTLVNDGMHRLMERFERGDLGEGDARQTADAKKFLLRYCNESEHTLPKFAFNADMHRARVVSYSYLRQNLIQLASYRMGIGGAAQSFNRAIKSLCDEGCIKELEPNNSTRFGSTGKLFALSDVTLLR